MLLKFFTWLKKPLIKKSKSTSPLFIIVGVTCVTIARNIPLTENTFDLSDLVFWIRSITVLVLVCWLTSVMSEKGTK